jgi:hypothetical protein
MQHGALSNNLPPKLCHHITLEIMDAAIAELQSSESPCIAAIARSHGVVRSTLWRRWKGITTSRGQAGEDKRLLNDQQEQQLLSHIRDLCDRCLPPTPAIVSEIASQLGGRAPGHNWCSRFVERHGDELDSRFLNSLDLERHQADSVKSFEQYFSTIGDKIKEYGILPENTYNMDEKGFLLGRITKARRIFPKDLKASGKLLGAGQDGSREWITVVATICGDGTTLPPFLIYDSTSGSIQDSWVQDFNSNEHDAWFTSSASGWTSDEIGFKWLERFFDKKTQEKARRQWRLLFVDGHGSHVTLKFLQWAQTHKILVAVYPPHSTHRLQPLDVGCFAPLATYYSQLLEQQTRLSEGQTKMTKRDFFKCFYPAWHKAFTDENVASSWRKAGLFPFNPASVLEKLRSRTQRDLATKRSSRGPSSSPSAYWDSPSGMRKLRAIVNTTVDRKTKKVIKRLSDDLQRSRAEAVLERLGKQKAVEALRHEKKKRKRGKKLMEQFRAEEGSGAIIFSPSKVRAALELQEQREQEKEQDRQDKEARTLQRALAKAQKQQEVQKRREDRAMARNARKAAEALKRAERSSEKEAKRAQKQAELEAKAMNGKERGRLGKKKAPLKPGGIREPQRPQNAYKQSVSRSGRTIRVPAHLSE